MKVFFGMIAAFLLGLFVSVAMASAECGDCDSGSERQERSEDRAERDTQKEERKASKEERKAVEPAPVDTIAPGSGEKWNADGTAIEPGFTGTNQAPREVRQRSTYGSALTRQRDRARGRDYSRGRD